MKVSNRTKSANAEPLVMPQILSVAQYFRQYGDLVNSLPFEEIERATEELLLRYERDQHIFLFGNGGSAALASHLACDLGKGTIVNGNGSKRFRVLSLTDNLPLMTAWANDSTYDMVFAEQLRNFISPMDVAFAISGSGNSPNVLRALEVAREAGAFTMGLTGFQGGKMKNLCDLCIIIPSENMQIIEDFHLSVAHALFSVIRQRLADSYHPSAFGACPGAD
jgi:D-sedoheptulose 7-phosphate isomerase